MYKFVTIYRRVDAPDVLERFFSETHLPLAEKLPGLIKSEVGRITGKPGGESRFHLMYELYFETEATFIQAIASEPGLALMEVLRRWEEARLLSWFFADAYDELRELPVAEEEE